MTKIVREGTLNGGFQSARDGVSAHPRPLQIISAANAVDIESLAHCVRSAAQQGLQVRVEFVGVESARHNLRRGRVCGPLQRQSVIFRDGSNAFGIRRPVGSLPCARHNPFGDFGMEHPPKHTLTGAPALCGNQVRQLFSVTSGTKSRDTASPRRAVPRAYNAERSSAAMPLRP